jgi:pyridoxamine 5'-phosphate oxidase
MPAEDHLPDLLPDTPFPLFMRWFDLARERKAQPNPNAMVLATADAAGSPSARIVLCKHIVPDPGYIVFFTNYQSHKGIELEARPRAAVVFHWDALQRQVRMEGPVIKSPPDESDAYFASRAVGSRIGAWASDQSKPLDSRAELAARVADAAKRFGVAADARDAVVPRPIHWGGFRLWPDTVELWIEGADRVHDRARWNRVLKDRDALSFSASSWNATRLFP